MRGEGARRPAAIDVELLGARLVDDEQRAVARATAARRARSSSGIVAPVGLWKSAMR